MKELVCVCVCVCYYVSWSTPVMARVARVSVAMLADACVIDIDISISAI